MQYLTTLNSFIDFRFYLGLVPEKLLIILICFCILNAFSVKDDIKSGTLLNSYLNYFAFFFFASAIYWLYYLYSFPIGMENLNYDIKNATFFLFYETFRINTFIIQAKIIIAILVGCSLLTAKRNLLLNNLINYEYGIVVSLATLGMFSSIMANNWVMLFLSLELQALCFLVLFAWNRRNLKAITAALKFGVVNFIASLFVLLAIIEIILYTGSFNMFNANPIYQLANSWELFGNVVQDNTFGFTKFLLSSDILNINYFIKTSLLSITGDNLHMFFFALGKYGWNHDMLFWDLVSFLLIMGFAIKLGLAPFGLWLQDLYTSVSLPVLTFFATAPKVTYMVILVSLYMNLFIIVNPQNFLNIIYIISIISIIIANLSMFSIYDNLLKLLAWSSIANMGLLLFLFSFNPLKSYTFVYIIYYTFGTLLLFLALQYIIIIDSNDKKRNILYFSDLTLLRHHLAYRPLCLIIIFSLLSAFGIPPLMGFWVKFTVISSIVSNLAFMTSFSWAVVTIILLITLIGGYNYLRIIYTILSETNNPHLNMAYLPISKEDSLICVVWFVLFQFLFFIGFKFANQIFDPVTIWKQGLYLYVN